MLNQLWEIFGHMSVYPYSCDRVRSPCTDDPCINGNCTDDGYTSTCTCDQGFTGSICQHSVDDCLSNTCQNESSCVDGHQNFTCDCPPGFNGKCTNTDALEKNIHQIITYITIKKG